MIGRRALPALPAGRTAERAGDGEAILKGYRMAALGVLRRGRAQVARALPVLDESPPAYASSLRLAAAEVARRAGAWEEAAELTFQAATDLAPARSTGPTSKTPPEVLKVVLGLAAEATLLPGSLARAEERVEAFLDEHGLGPEVGVPARALIELYRGRTVEARTALRSLPDEVEDRWASLWLDLWRAEAMLELGALAGLEQALDRVAGRLVHDERFAEPHLRYRALRAASSVMGAAAEPDSSPAADASRAALRRLGRYAQAFPLYRAWHAHLDGELALLERRDPEAAFEGPARSSTSRAPRRCSAACSPAR